MIRPAGLEAPQQIGRVERSGDMLKKMMSKVIKDTHASGRESMDIILSERLNAANEISRLGGFAPGQWVLSRLPRNPATMGDVQSLRQMHSSRRKKLASIIYAILLMEHRGIDTLINHMRGIAFPLTEHESKDLFRQHCRPGGPLSRQNGESMKEYVSRRRRCWTFLVQMTQ